MSPYLALPYNAKRYKLSWKKRQMKELNTEFIALHQPYLNTVLYI